MLTKEQILAADDLPKEVVEVPEWGDSVIVRSMTGTERDDFEQSIYDSNGKSKNSNLSNIRARLCSLTMVGENGKRLFELSDAVELGKKSAKALDIVFGVAQKLNGLSASDVDELAGK